VTQITKNRTMIPADQDRRCDAANIAESDEKSNGNPGVR